MDAVWDGRSDGSRNEASNCFGDRSTGRDNCGGEYGAPHCNHWRLCGVAVPKCVNSRSCGLGWCVGSTEALLY